MNVGNTSAVLDAFHSKERFIRMFVRRFLNDAHLTKGLVFKLPTVLNFSGSDIP